MLLDVAIAVRKRNGRRKDTSRRKEKKRKREKEMRSHKPIIAVVIAAVRGGNVEYTYIQFKSSSVVTVVAEGIARLK